MKPHIQHYFFCGIGGSGMMPLALYLQALGHKVSGSDRSRDQGATPTKFVQLEEQGIHLWPQDGSGIQQGVDALVVSSAIESSIPDVAAALQNKIPVRKRAEILAGLFNAVKTGIAVAGTSGKSSVTGMIAVMMAHAGDDPSVMNGGTMVDFNSGMRAGKGDVFVTETDESDGTIELFAPSIAVLNNITLDHKSFEELDVLFGNFVARARHAVVLNYDDAKVRALAPKAKAKIFSYALENEDADLRAEKIQFHTDGVSFTVQGKNVRLKVPGRHNVLNALAALSAGLAAGLTLDQAIEGLQHFNGIRRRLETVGTKNRITVIDDFGHNPDKIAAGLDTLKQFKGRLIVLFQPHGFGPMKLMGREIIDTFAQYLDAQDILFMPEIFYAGGTADRSVTSQDMIGWAAGKGLNAQWFETRAELLPEILKNVQAHDRVVIMGARDDSLSEFARAILEKIQA